MFANMYWFSIQDGNPIGRSMLNRHYSARIYKDGRKPKLFIGPGEKLVLLTSDSKALFVWRKYINIAGQTGVNCSVFRNEGPILSSELINEAELIAWSRWPGERLYTYVNPLKIRSTNPGYCFIRAGWDKCGLSKYGLIILEKYPNSFNCDLIQDQGHDAPLDSDRLMKG